MRRATRTPSCGAQPFDREEVLLGQRLRRRHHRALPAALDRAEQRVERDRGLAGADVSLQQPLHRHGPREIRVDLGDRVLLGLREGERKRLAVLPDQPVRRRQRLGDERRALGCAAAQRELQDDELVERQTAPARLGLLLVTGPVERDERVGAEWETALDPDASGQGVATCPGVGEDTLDETPDRLLGEVGRRRVHGCEVGSRVRLSEVVRLDLEPVAVRLPPDPQPRPRAQARLEPGLVEPGRPQLPGRVGDVGGEDVQPSPTPRARASDDHVEHRLLLAEQLRDRALGDRALVAPRAVREQVPDGRDAETSELATHRRPDPIEAVDRLGQP